MTQKKKRKCQLYAAAVGFFMMCSILTFSPLLVHAVDQKPEFSVSQPKKHPMSVLDAQPLPLPTNVVNDVVPEPETKVLPPAEKMQQWWQALLMPILSVLGMLIAAFLAGGIRKLVKLVEKKWDVDIPDSVEKMMAEKARWAIGWAEEKAETRLLYGDGKKTEGAQKTTEVVELLEKFADSLGYSDHWRKERIEELVLGVLHLERNLTIGSVGNRGKAIEKKKNGKPLTAT